MSWEAERPYLCDACKQTRHADDMAVIDIKLIGYCAPCFYRLKGVRIRPNQFVINDINEVMNAVIAKDRSTLSSWNTQRTWWEND